MKFNKFKSLFLIVLLIIVFTGCRMINQEQEVLFQLLDETVEDIDGNIYKTVKIGDQIWLKENLKVTHYRDGTPILNVYENDKWSHATDGAYCMVNNDSIEYKKTYGLLYNFYALTNSHKLCPEGWHVPTQEECMELINYLGGHHIAGKKIKENRGNTWKNQNSEATNESGFSGLPSGGRGRLGSPGDVGYYATWWSSTSTESLYAWHWGVFPDKPGIRSNPGHKASGFSVRCTKDK